MFDFLARFGGSKSRPSGKATEEARPKYYQPERYYMRGPGPAWHAAHPEASLKPASQHSDKRVSEER